MKKRFHVRIVLAAAWPINTVGNAMALQHIRILVAAILNASVAMKHHPFWRTTLAQCI